MGHKTHQRSDSEVSDDEVEGLLELQALQDSKEQKEHFVDRASIDGALADFELTTKCPWDAFQVITSSEEIIVEDVNNDLTRELAIYEQALEAVNLAKGQCKELGIKFSRPSDYFAEMVKSDSHMEKIRQSLVDESQQLQRADDAKRQRELKKFGKKVQTEVLQDRQKQKRKALEAIENVKRKKKNMDTNNDADELFDIAIEESMEERSGKSQRLGSGKSSKKSAKDSKYGFGGKKRGAKRNTRESAGDMSGFSVGRNKKPFGAAGSNRAKKPGNRPGKSKRQNNRK